MNIKSIMVHMELEQPNEQLLALAAELTKRLDATEVIGIAGCQPVQLVYQETYVSGEILAADREQIEAEMKKAEQHFKDAFRNRAKRLEWRCNVTPGSLAGYVASEARAADLVITGPDIGGSMFDHARQTKITDLVFRAGRPVMIVPKACNHIDLSHVMIGWKDTAECRRALAAGLPLLSLAGRISVATIAPEEAQDEAEAQVEDVVQWLDCHGLKAAAEVHRLKGADTACFRHLVQEKAPGLVVAGAYGRSRLQEWILGGVTGDLLINPDRPVLLFH